MTASPRNVTREVVEGAERSVQEQLQDWGQRTARHYLEKTGEVKELLLVLARTAESVGERDQRCAQQLNEVTARLNQIARLDDLTMIRASIVKSASELKCSIDRMAAEGKIRHRSAPRGGLDLSGQAGRG